MERHKERFEIMTNANETFEEEYEDYDAFDDEEDERGLSGFAVLIMGLVMIGAFFSVVWIAYQQGIKTGQNGFAGETPYVAADPEPIKIETAQNSAAEETGREVYDAFDGNNNEPVTVLTEGPEEPVSRDSSDPIGSIAADAGAAGEEAAADLSEEMQSRLASLAEEDAALLDQGEEQAAPSRAPSLAETQAPATRPTPASTTPNAATVSPARGDAMSGSHVVQVGAFRSDEEAAAQWSRLERRLGEFVTGKSPHVERADLGNRGVYHRLRIGPFRSSDEAKTYCSGLKERGQDCLVKSI